MARQTETARAIAERLRATRLCDASAIPASAASSPSTSPTPTPRDGSRPRRELIANMTSLGGVSSRIEARARWEGDRVPPGLLRLSVGLEDADALWNDLEHALGAIR